MKKLLAVVSLFALALALPAGAGVQIIDGSSNPVFTDLPANGTLGALNTAVTLTLHGQGTATVQVNSIGSQTLIFEGTVDNVNWFTLSAVTVSTGVIVTTTTTTGQWAVDIASLVGFRVRCSVYSSGSAAVFVNASLQASTVSLDTPLPTGSNTIGALTANQSVNVAQIAAATVSTAASGVQKVGVVGNAGAAVDAVAGAAAPANVLFTSLAQIGATAASTAAAGVLKVGVVGNANAALDAANNAAAPANVLVTGAQLQSGATATAGTAGQVGSLVAGLDHVLYVRPGGPVNWSCFVEAVTATTQCKAAPAAGIKSYVTSITCSNEAATAQTVDVIFGTGAACVTGPTALTHKFAMGTLATTTSPFVVAHTFWAPLNPTAANAICVRPTAATAFGCTLTGYDAP